MEKLLRSNHPLSLFSIYASVACLSQTQFSNVFGACIYISSSTFSAITSTEWPSQIEINKKEKKSPEKTVTEMRQVTKVCNPSIL